MFLSRLLRIEPSWHTCRARLLYARRVMGRERARATDRSDDPLVQFEAGRWSSPLCPAPCDHGRRRLILDPRAARIPPELSAVLKHEPERRSGAAQPALLVRLEGKTVRGEWNTNHVEKVWSSDQLCLRSAGGFVIREPSCASRVESVGQICLCTFIVFNPL